MTTFYRATVQRMASGEWQWSVDDGGESRPFAQGASHVREVALQQASAALAASPASTSTGTPGCDYCSARFTFGGVCDGCGRAHPASTGGEPS